MVSPMVKLVKKGGKKKKVLAGRHQVLVGEQIRLLVLGQSTS